MIKSRLVCAAVHRFLSSCWRCYIEWVISSHRPHADMTTTQTWLPLLAFARCQASIVSAGEQCIMSYAKVSWASPYKEEYALRRSLWDNTTYLSVICLRLISLRRQLIIYKQVDYTGAFDLLKPPPQSPHVHKHLNDLIC